MISLTRRLVFIATIPAALLVCSSLGAQDKAPERRVQANVVISDRDPSLQIQLPKQVHYVGADRWILYGVADCEIHVFVEADEQKNIQRFYWLQFESFLPSKPEMKHNYAATRTDKLGGMDFNVRARFGSSDEVPKQGSDLEHIYKLIEAKGYKLPAGMMNVRLVHLPDPEKRKELMIIYAEDIASTGFTVADLLPGGKASEQWPEIEKVLIERAEHQIIFRPIPEK
jgi:hypothetical protein